jgi:hypothetical protein
VNRFRILGSSAASPPLAFAEVEDPSGNVADAAEKIAKRTHVATSLQH